MTTLRDFINDFGRAVEDLNRREETEENKELYETEYERALEDCMDSVKRLMGVDE